MSEQNGLNVELEDLPEKEEEVGAEEAKNIKGGLKMAPARSVAEEEPKPAGQV